MTFRALLYAYIFGGLTFLPLVLAAILGLGWTLLPKVDEAVKLKKGDATSKKDVGDKDGKTAIDDLLAKKHEEISDGAASGTFAVLRKYDFQAANAALNARNNAGGSAAGSTAGGDSGAETIKESESVYQSMYRSVFDRSKGSNQSNSVLASEEGEGDQAPDARTRRRITPADVFYIVLRHGHLMLYDSPTQMEVRHVISLAHHSVCLTEGPPLPRSEEQQEYERNVMKDGDIFIKRTAILLTPIELPNGHLQSKNTLTKPFYLFSSTCSEKEDFYHSLLYTRERPPIPEPLEPNDAIKLQSILHSTSLTPETRALNALAGRIFLGLYHTDRAKQFIQSKVEKKISRVQKPAFIDSLAVRSIDLGDSAPVLSNLRLKDLHISGDMTIACDVKYTGGLKLTFEALAKFDLGTRFKTRTVDLVLATSLQRLQGHMLVRIKPPPSNRLWFCFESAPDMDIKVEPVVSQRQITYTFILRAIEDRIRAVVSETLVKPNWDDVPWFDTRGQSVRGGIWRDEGGDPPEDRPPLGAETLKERNTKTKSMPVLPGMTAETDSSATSSGSETASKLATGHALYASDAELTLKRRSVASLPAQSSTPPPNMSSERSLAAPPPMPLRSPSFNSSATPSVALDENPANIDPARSSEVPAQVQKKWRIRNATQQLPTRKEAVEAMREMRDRVSAPRETMNEAPTAEDSSDAATERPDIQHGEDISGHQRRVSDSSAAASASQPGFANRSLKSVKRTDTNTSFNSASSGSTQNQQRKQTILAATAAATNAAKSWSWNAYQTAKKNSPARAASTTSQQHDGHGQPMGRGQPLPPPGVPLPGPNKSLFGSFGGSVKRKPVLPPRRTTLEESDNTHDDAAKPSEKGTSLVGVEEIPALDTTASSAWEEADVVQTPMSDEFGPWRENSGTGLDLHDQSQRDAETDHGMIGDEGIRVTGDNEPSGDDVAIPSSRKAPPPLPPRRHDTATDSVAPQAQDLHDDDVVDLNAAPPAHSPAQAEAKFALGADLAEEDFENAPARDSVEEARTDESEREEENEFGELGAISAPIDDVESNDDETAGLDNDLGDVQQSTIKSPSAESKSGNLLAGEAESAGAMTEGKVPTASLSHEDDKDA